MDEPDPIKRMHKFSVKIEIKGRLKILKSLSLAEGVIVQQNEIQLREQYYKSFFGCQDYLTWSMFKRCEHHISKVFKIQTP